MDDLKKAQAELEKATADAIAAETLAKEAADAAEKANAAVQPLAIAFRNLFNEFYGLS